MFEGGDVIKGRAVYGTRKNPLYPEVGCLSPAQVVVLPATRQSKFTAALKGGRRGGEGGENDCMQLHPSTPDTIGHTCKEQSRFSQDLRNRLPWLTCEVIHMTGNKQQNQKCSFSGPMPAARKSCDATFAPAAPPEQQHSWRAGVRKSARKDHLIHACAKITWE